MSQTIIRRTRSREVARRNATRFVTRWTTSPVVIVSAYGDIDGMNAGILTDYAVVKTMRCRGMIVDLSGLEFFGTEGFLALHRISVSCARAGIGWVVIPGAAVSRVLQICDPHELLPTDDNVDTALATLRERGSMVMASRRLR
jgi:anti-anti-sigma factor